MPIFEFLCPACNRIYSFLSLSAPPSRKPVCPRCGATDLTRVPSSFAVSGREEEPGGEAEGAGRRATTRRSMARIEQEVMRMTGELGEKDAEDPARRWRG